MKILLFLCFVCIAFSSLAQVKDSTYLDSITGGKLKPVTIKTNKYLADSIRNRENYADVFNYQPKKINMGDNKWDRTIIAMGKKIALDPQKSLSLLDVDAVAEVVHSKKKKQTLKLRKHLQKQEEAIFIQQKFTPAIVEKYSNIHNKDSLTMFVSRYAPTRDQIEIMNELDLGLYIKSMLPLFRKNLPLNHTEDEEDFLLHLK